MKAIDFIYLYSYIRILISKYLSLIQIHRYTSVITVWSVEIRQMIYYFTVLYTQGNFHCPENNSMACLELWDTDQSISTWRYPIWLTKYNWDLLPMLMTQHGKSHLRENSPVLQNPKLHQNPTMMEIICTKNSSFSIFWIP